MTVAADSVDAVDTADPARRPVVVANDLAVRYGPSPVWSDASFSVEAGEFVAVLGPNGAGKSTLARALLGLIRPSAGSIEVLGRVPRRGNPDIGYVPQRRAIDRDVRLRGVEFVKLGLVGHRWGPGRPGTSKALAGDIAAAIAAVGAGAYAEQPIGELSGGELQRLLLAQAIVGRPQLLLLDEPLASLDLPNQGAMAQLVASLARAQGLAVLLVAHDVNPLLPVVDRVMYVARRQITIGPVAEVINSQRLSAIYDSNVEVLTDSHGRVFVVGLDEEASHPHHEPPARPDPPC